MKLDIKFNFNKVHAKIDKMRDKMTNLEPLMEEIGEDIESETALNFSRSRSPNGEAWTPLSEATKKQRRGDGSRAKILMDKGILSGSIAKETGKNYVRVWSTCSYAKTHQFGATINQEVKARTQNMYWKYSKSSGNMRLSKKSKSNFMTTHEAKGYSRSISIPARPFLGLNRAMANRYIKMIREYVGEK
jgi:phage virion morphogenesis (putative tail completion) protein